jgi:Reverse transcriptase (RNA-dependent DNA polymerase).
VNIHTRNKTVVKYNCILSKVAEINNGVCQSCPLLPTLFNIYLDEIVTTWQKENITGIPLPENQQLLTLLCADEQVIISNTEDKLQNSAHKLN